MRHLLHITTLAIAVLPAVAFASHPLDLAPCLTEAAEVEVITDGLQQAGWTLRDIKTLDEVTLSHLAWLRVASYLTTDTGGVTLPELLKLQLKTVKGIARKLDLPTGKTRVLTREHDATQDTVLVLWQKPLVAKPNITCQFVQTTTDTAASDAPRIEDQLPIDTSDDAAQRLTTFTKLNASKLPTNISAITATYWEAK